MQVAETFEMELVGESLKEVSQLDTCVTVVDASNLHVNVVTLAYMSSTSPNWCLTPICDVVMGLCVRYCALVLD